MSAPSVRSLHSHRWIAALVVIAMHLCAAWSIDAAQTKYTYTYKSIANESPYTGTSVLKADVFRPTGVTEPRPVIVYLHGGALINGNRDQLRNGIKGFADEIDAVLVSLDYRLGPEVKVPAIAQDVEDGLTWIRDNASLLGINPDRMVVTGSSAGSYLAQLSGTFEQKPTAIVSYWGYGSIQNPWYTEPSPNFQFGISQATAEAQVGQAVLTGTGPGSDPYADNRSTFYNWLRQEGLWTERMTGFDPDTEASLIAPYSPILNLDRDYPAAMLVHGNQDADVPHQESIDMAAALDALGVMNELIIFQGGHSFSGASQATISSVISQAEAFMTYYLNLELLTGDANNDGVVDYADFLTVEFHMGDLGTTNGLLMGDANDDGRVDGDDWLAVEQHFGATLGSPSVPEPGTVMVSLAILAGAVLRRRL